MKPAALIQIEEVETNSIYGMFEQHVELLKAVELSFILTDATGHRFSATRKRHRRAHVK